MLLSAPPSTPYDLRFTLLGIPVRVHPLFWLVSALFASNFPAKYALLWVAVVFVSVLVHEFGHALTIRAFGSYPLVVLYSFGGLAITTGQRRTTPGRQLLISLAGPGAGLTLAGLVLLVLRATHHEIILPFTSGNGILPNWRPALESVTMNVVVLFFIEINILWSLLNLLPVFPLDGGQACYHILTLLSVPDAMVTTLKISLVTAAGAVVFALTRDPHEFFLAALFAYMGYHDFSLLQAYTGRGGGYGRW